MVKAEVYRLREILHELHHIKTADTEISATADRFEKVYREGMEICERTINKLHPLKYLK